MAEVRERWGGRGARVARGTAPPASPHTYPRGRPGATLPVPFSTLHPLTPHPRFSAPAHPTPQVRARVEPLAAEVRSGGLDTSEGLSYLEAKHLLLLQYCAAVVVLIMLRAEGTRVEGHPVVTRWAGERAGWRGARARACVW